MAGWFRSGERIAAVEAEAAAQSARTGERIAAVEAEAAALSATTGELARALAALADRVEAQEARQDGFAHRLEELAAAAVDDGSRAEAAAALAELRASLASMMRASHLARADVDQALAALAGRVLAREQAGRHGDTARAGDSIGA